MSNPSIAPDIFDISDKNIVVTGANGYLGSAMTQYLAERASSVLAISRSSDRLESIFHRYPENLTVATMDIRDEEAVGKQLVKFSYSNGEIHGLVNNVYSGNRMPGFGAQKSEIVETFESTFIQYWTTIRQVQRFLAKDASIINNGSLFGMLSPDPRMYLDLKNEPSIALVTAKASVHQLTRYLAVLWAESGVRVNTIIPGMFPQKRGEERLDYMREVCRKIPMGRIGKPSDLLGCVHYLLSDSSAYLTGQELVIDGGYTII